MLVASFQRFRRSAAGGEATAFRLAGLAAVVIVAA